MKRLQEVVLFSCILAVIVSGMFPSDLWANEQLILRGTAKTLLSVFQLPGTMLQSSMDSFPLGLISGAVQGSVNAVMGTLSGVVDIARGAAPYAKYAIFLV